MNGNARPVDLSPVLVPAFPAVLRVGLPVVERGRPVVVFAVSPCLAVAYLDDGVMVTGEAVSVDLRLDPRDPTVRDAVVRAIWRKLRPDAPEPLTAPEFRNYKNRVFRLQSDGEASWFEPVGQITSNFIVVAISIPALASIPLDSPDRDLLALAEVAKAVLS